MTTDFRTKLTISMIVDFAGCYVMEKGCKFLFASLEPTELVTRGRERREKRRAQQEHEQKLKSSMNGGGMPELADVMKKNQ